MILVSESELSVKEAFFDGRPFQTTNFHSIIIDSDIFFVIRNFVVQ